MKPIHALALMLAFAALYFYQDPGWNGNSRLDAIRAVVEQGTFQIDAYHEQPEWYTMDKSVYQGHFYTDKGIGSSLLGLPIYFLLHRVSSLLGTALPGVLVKHVLTAAVGGGSFIILGLLLYIIAMHMAHNPWKAALAALAASMGTMLWPYSAVYYGHLPAAMLVAAAFYLLLPVPGGTSAGRYAAAGLAMGLAFITEYPTALIILGLAVYALYQLRGRPLGQVIRFAAAGALGAALPLAAMLLYNHAVYGSVYVSGYSHVAVPAFEAGLQHGYMGIGPPDWQALYHFTFDPQFGLFWQSPVLLLSFAGFYMAFRRGSWRAEALLAAYCIAALFLMNSGYFMWWGGAAFGARYVIPALPFFIVPLALLPDRLSWLLGALAALSAAQMLIPLLGSIQPNLRFDAASGHFWLGALPAPFSILDQYGLPLVFQLARMGRSPWTFGSAIGLPLEASAGLFVGVQATLAIYLRRISSRA